MDEAHKTCQEKYISQWSLHLCYSKENSRNIQKIYTICYIRAVRYDNIYQMDEIKSLLFHIMFYRFFCGVAKYIVYGNTFSSFEWLRRGDRSRWRTSCQDKTRSSFLNERTTSVAWSRVFKHCSFETTDIKPLKHEQQSYMRAPSLSALFLFRRLWTIT